MAALLPQDIGGHLGSCSIYQILTIAKCSLENSDLNNGFKRGDTPCGNSFIRVQSLSKSSVFH